VSSQNDFGERSVDEEADEGDADVKGSLELGLLMLDRLQFLSFDLFLSFHLLHTSFAGHTLQRQPRRPRRRYHHILSFSRCIAEFLIYPFVNCDSELVFPKVVDTFRCCEYQENDGEVYEAESILS